MPEADQLDQIDDEAADDAPEGQDEAAQPNPEAEKVARLMGWKPKEEWRGDQTNWRPAEDFLRETPEINRSLRKKVEASEGKLSRVIAEVAKLSTDQRQRMGAEAEARLKAAVESGDTAEALKVLKDVEAKRQPDEAPAFTDFKARNADWWDVDEEATAFAAVLDARYAKGGITDQEAHMKRVEAGVKKAFPALFEAGDGSPRKEPKEDPPTDRRTPLVARGNRADPSKPTTITASTLTREQKAAADEYGVSHADFAKHAQRFAEQKAQSQ